MRNDKFNKIKFPMVNKISKLLKAKKKKKIDTKYKII